MTQNLEINFCINLGLDEISQVHLGGFLPGWLKLMAYIPEKIKSKTQLIPIQAAIQFTQLPQFGLPQTESFYNLVLELRLFNIYLEINQKSIYQ